MNSPPSSLPEEPLAPSSRRLTRGLLILSLLAMLALMFWQAFASVAEREASSERLGNKLFLPALIIPVTALLGTLAYNYTPLGGTGLIEAKRETYVFLGVGVLLAIGGLRRWVTKHDR